MKLSLNDKESIVDEFRSVGKRMSDESDSARKMYFFSAASGVVNRAFNSHYNEELVLLHLVLSAAYGSINTRINIRAQGIDKAIQIPDNVFTKLQKNLEDLADAIEQEKDISKLIITMSNLAYVGTGNGYYLWEKGSLKI